MPLATVILSVAALYMIVGLVGSLTLSHSRDAVSDDDQYWFLGFYNNPDNPDLMVPSPNWPVFRVNIGHPLGLALTIATLLMIIGLAIFGALNW